jgi:3-methylcrotonyl-CoA carboxylase alpha subunit
VASGEALPKRQEELGINGWAMEARLYAENPATGFLPSTGRLEQYFAPQGFGRIDTGVEEGAVVTPFYDPMIAKLIAGGTDREACRYELLSMVEGVVTWPVHNNAGFLHRCLEHPSFAAGDVDTGLIARELEALLPAEMPDQRLTDIAASALLLRVTADDSQPNATLFRSLAGFRLNATTQQEVVLHNRGHQLRGRRTEESDAALDHIWSHRIGSDLLLIDRGEAYIFELESRGRTGSAEADGALISPMPGKIIAVEVRQGDVVAKGQKLVTLEAMKMEHSLTAPFDGVVAELSAVTGGQVSEGALLARIEKGEG